jgi:hypothetical protein
VRPTTTDEEGNTTAIHKFKFLRMDPIDIVTVSGFPDEELLPHGIVVQFPEVKTLTSFAPRRPLVVPCPPPSSSPFPSFSPPHPHFRLLLSPTKRSSIAETSFDSQWGTFATRTRTCMAAKTMLLSLLACSLARSQGVTHSIHSNRALDGGTYR